MYKNTKITTPITVLIFNRHEPKKLVIQEIQNVGPTALKLIADRPLKQKRKKIKAGV